MRESTRNQKTHSNERLEINDTRQSRPINRDNEIVIVDGKEYKRTPRTSLDRKGRFDLPKKPGYLRRWVSTSLHAPHSIQELINLGYHHATDENGIQIAPMKGGVQEGEEFKLVPMEISEEMYSQIERDRKRKIQNKKDEFTQRVNSSDLGSGSMTYMSQDSEKIITR